MSGCLISKISYPFVWLGDICVLERSSFFQVENRMLKLDCRRKRSAKEVVERIKSSFGKGGLGLHFKEETPVCLTFERGGGYVTATLCEEDSGTRVDLVTQEWDHQVKQFASPLG
jgi:hypothetical protein